jgi:hypothetical protein
VNDERMLMVNQRTGDLSLRAGSNIQIMMKTKGSGYIRHGVHMAEQIIIEALVKGFR